MQKKQYYVVLRYAAHMVLAKTLGNLDRTAHTSKATSAFT